jgi:endonuclease-3
MARAAKLARKPTLAAPETVTQIAARLADSYPDAVVELDFQDPYQLLVATILSAQSTDKTINKLTPALFAKYPDATALAGANQADVEKLIASSGFFRQKAKNIIATARACVERHAGEVPRTMAELVELPGVARKTANVVLGEAMGIQEGLPVDTHVIRLSNRLALSAQTDPVKIEQDLMRVVPRPQWTKFAQRLIWHGRRVCDARKPDCEHCTLAPLCPSAGVAVVAAAANKPQKKQKIRAKAGARAKAKTQTTKRKKSKK